MQRRTLSLKPRVDPATRPKVDPAKIAQSEQIGLRFIDRGGRYLMQKLFVTYHPQSAEEHSRTWVDVPLVPETYHV